MIIFLKNFYRIRIALLLYISSIAAVLIFFLLPFLSDGTAKVETLF